MKRRMRQKVITDINITPFTDVILVLLIVFMIATPLIYQSSVEIQLPKSSTLNEPPPTDINVSVTSQGDAFIGSKKYKMPVDSDLLKLQLTNIAQKEKDPTLIVSGDRNVKYDFVMQVIDIATSVGIKNVVLALQMEK